MSFFAGGFELVQVHRLGLLFTFKPPLKILSPPSSYRSTMWKVLFVSTTAPFAFNTNPPLPEFVTQSPMPLVGVFARRFPSMAKPPAGRLTGAVPAGGVTA